MTSPSGRDFTPCLRWTAVEKTLSRLGIQVIRFEDAGRNIVLFRPPNFQRHRRGWLPPNQHSHFSVLQRSWRPFWVLFPENCSSLFCDSPLNVASYDPSWMHGQSAQEACVCQHHWLDLSSCEISYYKLLIFFVPVPSCFYCFSNLLSLSLLFQLWWISILFSWLI